jgi:hypothetical protein
VVVCEGARVTQLQTVAPQVLEERARVADGAERRDRDARKL